MKSAYALLAALALPALAGHATAEERALAMDVSAFALPVADVSPTLAVIVPGESLATSSSSPEARTESIVYRPRHTSGPTPSTSSSPASSSGIRYRPRQTSGPTPSTSASPASSSGIRYDSIRYRPRHPSSPPPPEASAPAKTRSNAGGFLQLHGGVFVPSGNEDSNAGLAGGRIGSSVGKVQLGIAVDVSHRSEHDSQVVGSGTLPGGGTFEQRHDLTSVTADLIPVMGFVQISPLGDHGGGPYVGVAGGYQALMLSAEDFATGQDFDATYDGWGWQAFGGIALPLTPRMRITAEAFMNWGQLDRDVDDPVSGFTLREVVSVDGAGARAGFSWNF